MVIGKINIRKLIFGTTFLGMLLASPMRVEAEETKYEVSTITNLSTGSFAPYFISSNNHGIITQKYSTLGRISFLRDISNDKIFDYGYGLDLIGGYNSSTDYGVYSPTLESFKMISRRPSAFWIQQLYGELTYRKLFLLLGLKEHNSALLNQRLSSGDFIESGNSRPMPEIRIGLSDFVNIPFTNGWAQIQAEYSIAKTIDSNWLEDHYNYYNDFITTGSFYSYKRLFFRSNPQQPLSVTVGMQAAVQFGGNYRIYSKGIMEKETKIKVNFNTIINTLFPMGASNDYTGGDYYKEGNHLGSWDLNIRYRLPNNDIIKGYVQFPFEDGSGIGKLNGFDGIYGLEYNFASKGIVNAVVLEYLDFMNQSGPIHYSPDDYQGDNPTIPYQATGYDNYYNNFMYNGYQYYGMSIGTPFLKSPIYNTDGYMRFTDNRVRGMHFGIEGVILDPLKYRLLTSYRYSLGTPYLPNLKKKHDTSMMLEVETYIPKLPELNLKAQIAFDRGNLYGNNFGLMLSVSYKGAFNF